MRERGIIIINKDKKEAFAKGSSLYRYGAQGALRSNGGGFAAAAASVAPAAFVGKYAAVFGMARVSGHARICGSAIVCKTAPVFTGKRSNVTITFREDLSALCSE